MKAREVEGLDPGGPLRPNAARIVATRLDELRALRRRGARARRRRRPSTTCGSPPSGCATCSRSSAPASAPEAEAARGAAKELQARARRYPRLRPDAAQGRAASSRVAALLRERRELLFHDFVELWQAEAEQGHLGGARAALSVERSSRL